MKRFLPFLFFFVACNGSQEPGQHDMADSGISANTGQTVSGVAPGCYEAVFGKDSIRLKVEAATGDSVIGTLTYQWFQKDNNTGTFRGVTQQGRLIGLYTFVSEGTTSHRQVVFNINGDTLIEGYGDIRMSGDTAWYQDISKLKFVTQKPLVKAGCD